MSNLTDVSKLSKLLSILRIFGDSFLHFKSLCTVLMRYVHGEHNSSSDHNPGQEETELEFFKAETESLMAFIPESTTSFVKEFRCLHDFGMNSNVPTGCLLLTTRSECRSCKKKLSLEPKTHTIVVYHSLLGSFLGARATKLCRKCKIHEHYGFWSQDGKKHFDLDALHNEYILSTEDTAFHTHLLKEMSSLLIVGAVAFSTYADSYNRRFELSKAGKPEEDKRSSKRRKKDDVEHSLNQRSVLDRRRLEEGFLLFAALEVIDKHSLNISYYPCNRNELLESITEKYHSSFVSKWGDHLCNTPGCNNVVVIDGNMKNCRQVCSCKNVSKLEFEGLEGSISIGCFNTPLKGARFCGDHIETATKFKDDSLHMHGSISQEEVSNVNEDDVLPIKVLNNKETRNGNFFELLWSDARKSWVKYSNLPSNLRKIIDEGGQYSLSEISIHQFGQQRKQFVSNRSAEKGTSTSSVFTSSGFGKEVEDDNEIVNDDGTKSKLTCGTEKGKHRCKNKKTAGILVFEKPCGVVTDVRELFGSESKSQVYAHLHNLLSKPVMQKTEVVCYDDACHLKKFSCNPVRNDLTSIARKLSHMDMVCDRFHFKNHIDKWCRRNCNPYNCEKLQDVNTEVCEQLFSWLSRFSYMTKHMNRHRFLFLMIYVLDNHNNDVAKYL